MDGRVIAFVIGGALGALACMVVFKLIAGSGFQTWRQAFAAYLGLAIATVFISATGDANGGHRTLLTPRSA